MNLLAGPPGRRRAAPPLWVLIAATASGTLALHILVPALPLAADDLGVSEGAIQQTITLYVIGLALGQLVYGPLSDRLGRRPVLLAALALYSLGGVVAWRAADLHLLVFVRMVQAFGGCGGLVLGRAILRDTAEGSEAASRLALLNLVVAVGPTVAPVLGGYVALWFGWRVILAAMALLGLLTLAAVLITVPETAASRGPVALGAMLGRYGRLLHNRSFLGYALGGSCTTTSFYAYVTASPFIFVYQLHRPVQEVGIYYVFVFSGISLGSLAANRLIWRIAPRLLLCGADGVAVLGAATFFLAAVSGHLTVGAVVAAMMIVSIGAGAASPLAVTGAISTTPDAIGAASGLYGFIQMSFGAACTAIVGFWPGQAALAASAVLLLAMLLGQIALTYATRRGFGVPDESGDWKDDVSPGLGDLADAGEDPT
jgi:MFS transporter, DHA1 family, multidrug resistance protein